MVTIGDGNSELKGFVHDMKLLEYATRTRDTRRYNHLEDIFLELEQILLFRWFT